MLIHAPGRPAFARLRCGFCGGRFAADRQTVPVVGDQPCCRACWDLRQRMRVLLGLPEQARPPSYVEDFPALMARRAEEGRPALPAGQPLHPALRPFSGKRQ